MKTCRKCHEPKPLEMFSIDRSTRDGLRSACKPCEVKSTIARRSKNKELHKQKSKAWREDNQDTIKNNRFEYKEQNKDYDKEYYQNNRERQIAKAKQWNEDNKARRAMAQSKRRTKVLLQIPSWADKEAICDIYEEASKLRDMGFDVHVDHIVPLNSDIVSGFHCESNLRIINATENISKGNRTWPQGPDTIDEAAS